MTVIVVVVLMVDIKIWKEFQRLLHQSVGLWDTDMSLPPNALKTEMPNENISSSDSTSPHNNDYETDASITSRTEKRTCWKAISATTKNQRLRYATPPDHNHKRECKHKIGFLLNYLINHTTTSTKKSTKSSQFLAIGPTDLKTTRFHWYLFNLEVYLLVSKEICLRALIYISRFFVHSYTD